MKRKIQNMLSIIMLVSCIILMTLCITSCKAQNKDNNPIEETDEYLEGIIFEFEGVDSCMYCSDDMCFIIFYEDADAFDYEALANYYNHEWNGNNFIMIDIEDSLVGEFLVDYHEYLNLRTNYKEHLEEIDSLSSKWILYKYDLGTDCLFELTKSNNPNWWSE